MHIIMTDHLYYIQYAVCVQIFTGLYFREFRNQWAFMKIKSKICTHMVQVCSCHYCCHHS